MYSVTVYVCVCVFVYLCIAYIISTGALVFGGSMEKRRKIILVKYDVIGHVTKFLNLVKTSFVYKYHNTVGKRTILAFERAQNQLHISIRSLVMSILVIG